MKHARSLGIPWSKVLRDVSIVMLTTLEEDGTLRSRPMALPNRTFDGALWFFTRLDAPKSHEIQEDQRVVVTFADPAAQRYVSISGEAELVRDRRQMEVLWEPHYAAWIPRGLDDPDLALLRVTVQHAESWDPARSCMVSLETEATDRSAA